MAVVNTKSTLVTNADASPRVMATVLESGAKVRSFFATLEIAAADDDLSVYRFIRVKSHWRIKSIRKFGDTITGATDYDLGLYDTAENGGAAVDANVYADAISVAVADLVGTELAFEARAIEDGGNLIWEDLALTSDPGLEYDLCLVSTTNGTGAGTVCLEVEICES